jgi:predicted MFS family arabinose efflux permease
MFVLARAIVGLGYGFCWMTLRNLSLFGRDAREQMMGFALLNAGIYAGMNCGSALGAILAEIFGYKMVFVASAAFTLATSIIIIRMENALLPRRQEAQDDTGTKKMPMDQLIKVIAFVVLMIAPASIACSYLSYYIPLYFESIGRSVADVGRAQLLYGTVIVYAGPFLSAFVAVFRKRGLETFNYVYNLVISLSLLLPGLGAGIVLPFVGAMLLGIGDSFGFGAQNNYFLSMNAVRALGSSKSLSVLSFVKKLLEMTGPIVFAFAIALGYRVGIIVLAISFAAMCVVYFGINLFSRNEKKREVR